MDKLEVTVVGGGASGIDPDTLQRIVDAAHKGEDILISVNHEGVLSERILSDDEKELLKEHCSSDDVGSIDYSIRSIAPRVAIVGHSGQTAASGMAKALAEAARDIVPSSYDFSRLAEEHRCVELKTEPFRGHQRKQIPPRTLKVQRRR